MKALVKVAAGEGKLELREVPEPEPGPGDVKIEVKAASICGSDLHILKGDIGIPMRFPVIPGHEFAGVVAAVGDGVASVRPGERVTAENTRVACGICPQCAGGSYNLCPRRLATGYAFDGAFTRFVVVPEARVHKLPDNVDFRCGALTDPSACAFHAVQERTGIEAGDVVLLTGPGSMGLFALQYVLSNGGTAILVGTPKDGARLALGRTLGAEVFDCTEAARQRVLSATGGRGADVCLECAGAEPAMQFGLELLKREGKFTQVGIFGRPVGLDLDQVLYKEIRLTGSFSQKYQGWEKALALCSRGGIQVEPLITHTFPLDRWADAFACFAGGEAIKVVFDMEAECR